MRVMFLCHLPFLEWLLTIFMSFLLLLLPLFFPPPGKVKVWTAENLAAQATNEDLFLALVRQCNVVICCRVSPIQKAKIVKLVKRREKVRRPLVLLC